MQISIYEHLEKTDAPDEQLNCVRKEIRQLQKTVRKSNHASRSKKVQEMGKQTAFVRGSSEISSSVDVGYTSNDLVLSVVMKTTGGRLKLHTMTNATSLSVNGHEVEVPEILPLPGFDVHVRKNRILFVFVFFSLITNSDN